MSELPPIDTSGSINRDSSKAQTGKKKKDALRMKATLNHQR